ncbi:MULTISPECIES: CDF family Co(II)/Ni(II) efflux transporter DmeF [unclassified Caballeronia]|uniref:CDF family Co(II)/Ni(II) efflux transporter DmeF n=1 Tax=unclassified Caballeronia TaxID=2646786 RepID=UPI00286194A8|nr:MULTISPECIES: CDF family Co(II)/Ni(II) efflux transporter DmeF [unclassified Caballeronia]MDR5751320.1 CDF family Co(II)/Ni(II) efflux transporter DmeF [Caballeronia sp. LZ024]MDR5844538.1 CDF family Co(II)/Ni(II) efflux transporter DmeF [Caballeronia sp. LZ031]
MNDEKNTAFCAGHDHIFLGAAHEQNERKTWAVIALCSAMMVLEIVGGTLFGSLALVADGLHMSTHAGAMLIAALAYTYARKHATDSRFVFGTGKLGDLAGFSSAIVLAMIALLIGYEAVARFISPIPIHFREAIPIAVLGLAVNLASVWLLRGNHHGHGHGHEHEHDQSSDHPLDAANHGGDAQLIATKFGHQTLSIFEHGIPPVFRITPAGDALKLPTSCLSVDTVRPGGSVQKFDFVDQGDFLESTASISEPHEFKAIVRLAGENHEVDFAEHSHAHAMRTSSVHRDHNIRSAYVHVIADAAVSVLAIVGLLLAWTFGWNWMDPLAGIIGALVIANWAYGLMRDTGPILLDVNTDERTTQTVRSAIEDRGDKVLDLHVWRVGPGHMSAVLSVATDCPARSAVFYHGVLQNVASLSHVTVEVRRAGN